MPRFVVYEVWTRHRIVEARSIEEAYEQDMPPVPLGMNLCNWHAVEIPESTPKPILGLVQKGER